MIATGKWLRVAADSRRELVEGERSLIPSRSFRQNLKESEIKADIFTFSQKLPDTTPKHEYHLEWENVAVIPITTFPTGGKASRIQCAKGCQKGDQELGVDSQVGGIR